MLLANRIVTGGTGSNGQGFCAASMLTERGAEVVIMDLDVADSTKAAEMHGEVHMDDISGRC